MKKKTIIMVVVVSFLLLLIVFGAEIKAKVLFSRLWLNRKDTTVAREVAEQLAEFKAGIRVCINDIGVYGGRTQGWSSYAVRNTKLPDYTREQLRKLVEANVSLSQKVEAYILLWEMQKEIGYLVKLYENIYTASSQEMTLPAERGYARNYLLKLFKGSQEAEALFNKTSNEELELTPEEFKTFAEQYFLQLQSLT